MFKKICTPLLVLSLVFLLLSCIEEESSGKFDHLFGISDEARFRHDQFIDIVYDIDNIESENQSLDTFLIDSLFRKDSILVSYDSLKWESLRGNFELKIGDTVLLEQEMLIFNKYRNWTAYQCSDSGGSFRYLTLVEKHENSAAVNYISIDSINVSSGYIDLNFPAWDSHIKFILRSIH